MAKRSFLAPIIICLVILASCASKPYPYVSLSTAGEVEQISATENATEKPLKIALASITSAAENQAYYDELLSYLSQRLQLPVNVIQRSNYAEVNVLLRAGLVDLAFICTYSYVVGHDQFGMELVAVPQIAGKTTYNSYLIARRGEGIRNLDDLRGRVFAFTDPMSTTGYFYPMARLIESGQDPDTFFKSYIFTYSHDNSIRAVAEGLADGAAVDSLVFDYLKDRKPATVQNLQILEVSPPYAAPPVVVRPNLKADLKAKIRQVFLTMHEEKEGQKVLADLGVERYVPIDDKAYESVRQLKTVVIRNSSTNQE